MTWNYVALGDSWPEGAHCGGCRTFAGLWADDLAVSTGRRIVLTDLTGSREPDVGEGETSASLLSSLRTSPVTRDAIKSADIILISTGPNELGMAYEPSKAGTCGGADEADCIRALGRLWKANFDAILTEIETLRQGRPTAIRLVDAANPFVSDPEMSTGMPAGFATTNGALIFELLKEAMCDNAKKHHAVCVDVRPILNGPTMDKAVDENSPQSMRAIADALDATKLAEI
jgi:lysophospholipase L1-like esterase